MGFTRINNDELKNIILGSSDIKILQKLIFVDTRKGIENISVHSFNPSMNYYDIVSLFDDMVIAFKPDDVIEETPFHSETVTTPAINDMTQNNSIHNTIIDNHYDGLKKSNKNDSNKYGVVKGDNPKKRGVYNEPLTYDTIYNYYVIRKMSVNEICKKMGVPKGTMLKFLHDNNIKKNSTPKQGSIKEEPV